MISHRTAQINAPRWVVFRAKFKIQLPSQERDYSSIYLPGTSICFLLLLKNKGLACLLFSLYCHIDVDCVHSKQTTPPTNILMSGHMHARRIYLNVPCRPCFSVAKDGAHRTQHQRRPQQQQQTTTRHKTTTTNYNSSHNHHQHQQQDARKSASSPLNPRALHSGLDGVLPVQLTLKLNYTI